MRWRATVASTAFLALLLTSEKDVTMVWISQCLETMSSRSSLGRIASFPSVATAREMTRTLDDHSKDSLVSDDVGHGRVLFRHGPVKIGFRKTSIYLTADV